jgi:hypothetical protein
VLNPSKTENKEGEREMERQRDGEYSGRIGESENS